MSIAAVAGSPALAATSLRAISGEHWAFAAGLLLLLVSLGLIVFLRVPVPRRIAGPVRLPLREPMTPLVLTLLIAGFTWFGVQVIYGSFRQLQWAHQGHHSAMTPGDYTPRDFALLSTLPGVIGFACLLVGDRFAGKEMVRHLGFNPRKIPRGIAIGLLGLLIVVPLVYGVMFLSDLAYKRIHYEHAKEHDLLKNMGEAHNPITTAMLMFGAAVVAPFFEEYLFRGHLQTLLKRWFIGMSRRRGRGSSWADARPSAFPLTPPGEFSAPGGTLAPPLPPFPPPMTIYPPAPEHYAAPAAAADGSLSAILTAPDAAFSPSDAEEPPGMDQPFFAWQSWLAVLITSLLFAGIHPLWSVPGIFILSLGLGYVYERTGNLWACITIHLLFNSISTAYYMLGVQHG